MGSPNKTLKQPLNLGEWLVTLVLTAAGFYYFHLGVWFLGLIELGFALLWAPSIGAHPVIRLIAIIVGFHLL